MRKLIFILLACIFLGFVFWKLFLYQGCTPPVKPENVPILAIWSGDCDGGEWIELVEIKEDKYRFRIYQDWNGELKMDADFEFMDDKTNLTHSNWRNKVCCYSQSLDSLVILSVRGDLKDNEKHYHLQSIYPPYGGSDWEIIKEKFKIN